MQAPVVRSLKGDRAFQRLRRGTSGGARYLSVRWRRAAEEGLRVGIVVSRKVGNAVVRNRVRRRLREGLQALMRERTPRPRPLAADLIVIARPDAAGADYHALRRALTKALERAGFL